MKKLSEMQKEFSMDLYGGRSSIKAWFTPETSENLSVYQKNLLFSLLEILEEVYPVTKIVLGEANFKFFSREFIYQNPSKYYDIEMYGAGFSDFLNDREELKEVFYISDFSKLEWEWRHLKQSQSTELYKGVFECWEVLRRRGQLDQNINIEEDKAFYDLVISPNE